MRPIRFIATVGMAAFLTRAFQPAYAQETTPEPKAARSLFLNDTCAPPCWFGLTPGESTAEEIITFFDAYKTRISVRPHRSADDIVDSATGRKVGTEYSFVWHDASYFNPPKANLIVKTGVLYYVWAQPTREITFGEMLDTLGYPDHLHLGEVGWSTLTAIYEKPRLRILLDSRSPSSLCKIQAIENEFRVMEVNYFSIEAAQELLITPTLQDEVGPQSRLLLRSRNAYGVSAEQFEQWIDGEETRTCLEVWEHLRYEAASMSQP